MKKCLGWHFDSERGAYLLRDKTSERENGATLAVTQPVGYRVATYRVGVTAKISLFSIVKYEILTKETRYIYDRFTLD